MKIRKSTGTKLCKCGSIKDCRAKQCAKCAGKSFPAKENGIPIYNDKFIIETINNSKSILEVSKITGHCRRTIKKYITEKKIDVSHFKGCNKREYSLKSIFTIVKKRMNNTIIKYGLKYNLLQNKCYICNQDTIWNNSLLKLELHHINGNPLDNNISNLQLLCPNCHSQTDTNKGKNSKKLKRENEQIKFV